MLEKILEDINSNLVRIANVLENKKILEGPETAVVNQKVTDVSVVTPAAAQTIQPQETIVPATTIPATVIPSTAIPATVIPSTAIPATPQTESFTQEQLAVAMSNAVSAGKMNVIMEILGKFNVQALTQINPADYNKLATMLREAGVNV